MTERLILIILISVPLLYSVGGMGLPPFGKAWRRYGVPLLLAVVALIAGSLTLKVGGAILLTCGALHLGYGESSGWIKRMVYAGTIALPTLLIAFNFWVIVVPVVFLGTWVLSNHPKWQFVFPWRVCEFLVGTTLGILWSQLL